MRNKAAWAALLATAAAGLAQLDPGVQPSQGDLLGLILDNLLAVLAIIVALIIVIILYLLRRRRRRSFRLKP
jgi:heme/copper-type cytochrome/quinol oxidase subunit 2